MELRKLFNKREFTFGLCNGFVASLFLISCAGFTFHFYGMDGMDFDKGTLLGPDAKSDLPFARCKPNEAVKHPCIVLFAQDFYSLKLDYEDTKSKLSDCEKKKASLE